MSAAASSISTQTMKITKVKEHIGAIVTGIDLAHPVDGATQKKLYDAVVENVVLVIRGQEHLTPGQVQAAGGMFGELMEDQNRRYLVDGFPLISVLDNRHLDSKVQLAKIGANATWHTDHTNRELPPKFTMLYAVAVPDKGGATSVCNARAAYEALPDDVKLKIADAKTENTLISSARMSTGNPDVVKAQLAATKPPTNESWWPSYTAWQAFAVKVLAEGGRNVDSHITRLYGYRERMPVFALAYLYDALVAKREGSGPRVDDLRRRMGNAILPEAATAHVEELNDPYLMWYWNSNVRSTAIALNSLVKGAPKDAAAGAGDVASYRALVAWLLLWAASDWRSRRKLVFGFGLVMALLLGGAEFVLPGWLRMFAAGMPLPSPRWPTNLSSASRMLTRASS